MSLAAAEKERLTVEEYLQKERVSVEKHEYWGGEIFAMAGASHAHNLIVANTIFALMQALRGKCLVYPSDMRLHVPASGLFTYPDVSVVCGPPQFLDGAEDTLENPAVLVEVLSPATESYDRGKKFEGYRSIPSFADYLLIAQDRVMVEHYRRQEGGGWLLVERRAGEGLRLGCGEIAVDDLYLGLERP